MGLHLSFVMPSDPHFLPVVRAAVSEVGAVCGLPEESCREVTLAVDEALANVIRHAYRNRYNERIVFTCETTADKLVFTLLDQGIPPDPSRICGQPLDEVSLTGRGTHLMKAIMDDMCYEQVPAGNQLTLVKRLPGASLTAEAAAASP